MKKRKKKARSRAPGFETLAAKMRRFSDIEDGKRKGTASERKEMDDMRYEVLEAAITLMATAFVYRIVGGLEEGNKYDYATAHKLGEECVDVVRESLKYITPSVLARRASGAEAIKAPLFVPTSWHPLVQKGMASFGVTELFHDPDKQQTH